MTRATYGYTVLEYRAAVMACAMARQLLQVHDLEGILQEIASAEVTGPMLDPTLYRDKSKAMAEDRALIEAALPLARFGAEGREP